MVICWKGGEIQGVMGGRGGQVCIVHPENPPQSQMAGADLSFVTVGLSFTVANGFPPLRERNGGEKKNPTLGIISKSQRGFVS